MRPKFTKDEANEIRVLDKYFNFKFIKKLFPDITYSDIHKIRKNLRYNNR